MNNKITLKKKATGLPVMNSLKKQAPVQKTGGKSSGCLHATTFESISDMIEKELNGNGKAMLSFIHHGIIQE